MQRNYIENAIHLILEDDPSIFWAYSKYLTFNELTSQKLLKAVLISGNLEFISKFINHYHPEKIVVEDDLFECLLCYCFPRAVRLFKKYIHSVILKNAEGVATDISYVLFRLSNQNISRDNVSIFKNIRILQDYTNHYNIINMIIQNIDKNHKSCLESYKKYLSKNLLVHVGLLKKNLCYVNCKDYYNYLLNFHQSRNIYESFEMQSYTKNNTNNELRLKIDTDIKFIMDNSLVNNKKITEFKNSIKRHNVVFKMLKNFASNIVMNSGLNY
jgi:hypothetical protein